MFEPTGEVRSPLCGEFFKGSDGDIIVARFDFEITEFPIYRYTADVTSRRSQWIKNEMPKQSSNV